MKINLTVNKQFTKERHFNYIKLLRKPSLSQVYCINFTLSYLPLQEESKALLVTQPVFCIKVLDNQKIAQMLFITKIHQSLGSSDLRVDLRCS